MLALALALAVAVALAFLRLHSQRAGCWELLGQQQQQQEQEDEEEEELEKEQDLPAHVSLRKSARVSGKPLTRSRISSGGGESSTARQNSSDGASTSAVPPPRPIRVRKEPGQEESRGPGGRSSSLGEGLNEEQLLQWLEDDRQASERDGAWRVASRPGGRSWIRTENMDDAGLNEAQDLQPGPLAGQPRRATSAAPSVGRRALTRPDRWSRGQVEGPQQPPKKAAAPAPATAAAAGKAGEAATRRSIAQPPGVGMGRGAEGREDGQRPRPRQVQAGPGGFWGADDKRQAPLLAGAGAAAVGAAAGAGAGAAAATAAAGRGGGAGIGGGSGGGGGGDNEGGLGGGRDEEEVAALEKELEGAVQQRETARARAALERLLAAGGVPSCRAYSRVVAQLCLARDYGGAQRLFARLEGRQGLEVDADAFGLLVLRAAQAGDAASAALSVLSALSTLSVLPALLALAAGVAPDVASYNTLVSAYIDVGELAAAEAIVRDMWHPEREPRRPDVQTLSILIKGFVRDGNLDRACQVLASMHGEEGPAPNEVAYTTVIAGFVRAGDMAEARALLSAMAARGIPADIVTYNALLAGYCAAGQLSTALALLEDMHRLGGAAADSGVADIDGSSGSTASDGPHGGAGGHWGGGHGNPSSHAVDAGDSGGPDGLVGGPGGTARGGAAGSDAAGSGAAGGGGGRAGVFPRPSVVSYNTLIDGCVAADDSARALELFVRMRAEGLRPGVDSYTTLVKAFGRSGQTASARRVFDEMRRDQGVRADRHAWHTIVDCYARASLMDDALTLFRDMQAAGLQPSLPTYGTLFKSFARLGMAPEALVLWREMTERMEQQRAAAGGEAGRRRRRAWVHPQDELLAPDEQLLDDLVSTCVRAGYFQRALEIVAWMEDEGMPADRLKYKRLFIKLYSDFRGESRAASRRGGGEEKREFGGGAGRSRPKSPPVRSQSLEAFKFWLGLPNRYYQKDEWGPSAWRDEE
eukprot:jgi/Mesen1/9509/ME000637S08962